MTAEKFKSEQYLTVNDLMKRWQLSRTQVIRFIKAKTLEAKQFGGERGEYRIHPDNAAKFENSFT